MSLNPRQKKFAELYHLSGNATRAYGDAYNSPKDENGNYPHWVCADGNRLVRNGEVKAYLDQLRGEDAVLASMSREETLDYLVSAILTPIGEIGPDSPLCEEYEVKPDGAIKTKSVSKIAAIKELARLTGMNAPEKVEVSGDAVAELVRMLSGAKK